MSSIKWSNPGRIIPIMAVSAGALLAGAALAEPPPADTVIGNQAAATFVSNGEEVTVQSNLVETVVNEIYGLELNASQSRDAAPGGFAFFPHTLTNNANTDDTFSFITDAGAGDDFAYTDILIFADADQDGVPDNLTPITQTPSLLAGETFGLVVRATVPASANPGQASDFDLTATSLGSLADSDVSTDQTATNTDAATVTTDGIIELQKDQTLQTDADGNGVFSVGDTVRVNLTYSNTGIADASAVTISDTLPTLNAAGEAVELQYVAGSGIWTDAPGTVLTEDSTDTDASNAQGASLSYAFDNVLTVDAVLDVVPAGRSGAISFDYIIVDAPRGEFVNIASVETTTQTPTNSNGSPIDIASVARLIVADAEGTDLTGAGIVAGGDVDSGTNLDEANASTTDSDAAVDDQITDDSRVFAGGSLLYDFVLTNLGNDTDTYDLSVANTSFPAGTLFDFVAEDGVTPIIGDNITIASGDAVHAQLRVTLPATAPETAAAAGFAAVITGTSQADSTVSNTTNVVFDGEVAVPSVDLTNTDGAGTQTSGVGNGNTDDGGDPFVVSGTNPGEQVTFDLQVALAAGDPANSFDLAVEGLPDGWAVEFFLPDGTPIQNTGALIPTDANGAVLDYIAVVTVPEGASAEEIDLLFTATSPSNGASDAVLNAVSVNEIVDLSLAEDTDVQAAPGGVALISHTITNLGNSTVVGGALTLGGVDPFTDQGLAATLFYDANNNGELDPSDPLISDLSTISGSDGLPGLAPGEDARVIIRVQVPATSGLGLVETGDLAIGADILTEFSADATDTFVDSDLTNNAVLDSVAIISGDVTLVKEQSLDIDCDGTVGTFTRSRQEADPGQCIVYRLQADNTGTNDAIDLILRDTVPAFTTFETCGGSCVPNFVVDGAAGAVASVPNDGDGGAIATALPGAGLTLSPGSRAELTFTVQIDE